MAMPRLEVFAADPLAGPAGDVIVTDVAAFEHAKRAAFQQGHQAGWAEAEAHFAGAQHDERALARHLQGLTLRWQAARRHVLRGLAPLFQDIVELILPDMARDSLAPRVLAEWLPLAARATDVPPRLRLHPASRNQVETLLRNATGSLPQIEEDIFLPEGEVQLHLGEAACRVDITRALAATSRAVTDYFTLSQEHADG